MTHEQTREYQIVIKEFNELNDIVNKLSNQASFDSEASLNNPQYQ